MWWPYWLALSGTLAAVTLFTDRQAFVTYVTIFASIVAMRWAVHAPFFLGPLTVFSVAAAIIISTNSSILVGVLAFLLPFPYLFAVFGWPVSHAYLWGDVLGLGVLLVAAIPSGLIPLDSWRTSTLSHRLGLDSARIESPDFGALRAWPMAALAALGKAQAGATPEAVERVSGD